MGSFDVSCAVSGLHIGVGDECLAFQATDLLKDKYDMRLKPYKAAAAITESRRVADITKRVKEASPIGNCIQVFKELGLPDYLTAFGYGVYEDYGCVAGVDIERVSGRDLLTYYVAKNIVDFAIENYPPQPNSNNEIILEIPELFAIAALDRFCYLNRRIMMPFGWLVGCQHFNQDEFMAQNQMIRLKQSALYSKQEGYLWRDS